MKTVLKIELLIVNNCKSCPLADSKILESGMSGWCPIKPDIEVKGLTVTCRSKPAAAPG